MELNVRSLYLYLFLSLALRLTPATADTRYPLEPTDTSSPRATMRSFQNVMRDTKQVLVKSREWGLFSSEAKEEIKRLRNRSLRCLDLSNVPERLVEHVGLDAVVLLAEILDRIELPPLGAIPGAESLENGKVSRWTIPHTEITIARVEKGSQQGDYLFSPETVDRLKVYYTKVKALAYRPDAIIGKVGSAGGLYQYHSASPPDSILIHWVERMPSWARGTYFDHAVWQWIAMMLTLPAGALMIVIFVLSRRRTVRRYETGMLLKFSRLVMPLGAMIVLGVVDYLIVDQIGMSGKVYDAIESLLWVSFLAFIMWFVFDFGRVVAEMIIGSPKIDPRGIHASLIKTASNLIGFAIAVGILFHGLSELGVSLIPILTGLGVGGLAVALAARPTLENLIGGLMILIDRPYRIGQRIRVKDHDGVVEEIGMRSTKIRLIDGHQTTIPNEEMARTDIENIGRREFVRRRTNITITHDTALDKVEKAVQIIREILDNHEGMDPNRPPRVYFNDFNPGSLNIMMIYWYYPPNWWDFQAFNQSVNVQIMQEFNKEEIKFAFPTTTTYLAQGHGDPLQVNFGNDDQLPVEK